MKWLAAFLATLFALIPSASPLFPPENQSPTAEILYATPRIDGVLDEEYTQSHFYAIRRGEHLNYGGAAAEAMMAETYGTTYYLHDEDYLYICAVVHDETIVSLGENWRYSTTWPWNDDGAELYVSYGKTAEINGKTETVGFAVHIDAFGYRAVVDEVIWGDNHATKKQYHNAPFADYAVSRPEENVYIVEIRFALDEGMGVGSTVGGFLELDDRFSPEALSNSAEKTVIGARFPMPRDPWRPEFQAVLSERRAVPAEDPFELYAFEMAASILP